MNLLRFLPALACASFSACIFSGDSAETGVDWTRRVAETADSQTLTAVASNGEKVVAVGIYGAFSVSSDGGIHWTAGNTGTTSLWEIAFGNGKFVAVGHDGTIATSEDGTSWTERVSGIKLDLGPAVIAGWSLHDVTWGRDRFVAVGEGGHILSSPDGIAWTVVTRRDTLNHLRGVAWTGEQFVAMGTGDSVFYSTDGAAWNSRFLETYYPGIKSMTWAAGRLVIVDDNGGTTSLAPPDWEPESPGYKASQKGSCYDANAAAYTGTLWVLVGPVMSCTSSDWAKGFDYHRAFWGVYPHDVVWTGKRLVAVAEDGEIYTSP